MSVENSNATYVIVAVVSARSLVQSTEKDARGEKSGLSEMARESEKTGYTHINLNSQRIV